MSKHKLLLAALLCLTAFAPAQSTPANKPEAIIDGLARKDPDTITLDIPNKHLSHDVAAGPLAIHHFSFDGVDVNSSKLHFKLLSPGVYEFTSLAYTVGQWQFHIADAANYYGLGERFDALNHAHTIVRNSSQDNAGNKGSSTYKPIPFFMSTTGYGLWVDTTADATFDMNATSNSDIIITVAADRLRLVLFTGPKFPQILDAFTNLAGRTILPPYWAFAPWKSRDYHQNQAQVAEDVDRTRALGLPCSVILIDSPWAEAYNNYKFNGKQFDDAPAMVKHIHEEGYKLVLWHTSWINSISNPPHEAGFEGKIPALSDNYKEAAENGYFVKAADGSPYVGRWWKGLGSLIDFTNPAAKKWWQDQVRLAITAGADGFKDDDAEGSFLGDVKFHDGTDQRVMRNRYAVLYNNAMEELVQKDLHGNGVLFVRSATVGDHNLGMLWGGDNEASFSPENGLPTVVTAGLGAGLSGMSLWVSDLGAYEKAPDTPNPNLFMRWTEYSAFSPAMEVISESNLGPWDYGAQALSVFRKYAVLHMSLFPYRYAAAQESVRNGMPIMRALVLNYQDDNRARLAKDEYLFGPDFLVAPVVDENTQRPVYIPAGEWVNYWTGAQVSGNKIVISDAPIETIPVYARAGAVIPRIPDDVMTLVPTSESGNQSIHTLDDRRVYELIQPFTPTAPITLTDFEGRTITRDIESFKLTGGDKQIRVTLRWKFGHATAATVNGASVRVQQSPNGPYIEFSHTTDTTVIWH